MYTLKPAIFVTFAAAILTASTAPTSATGENTLCQDDNDACDPQIVCEDISWTCSIPAPTTAAGVPQIPREDQYCCDYLGSCSSGKEVSGKVSSRKITVQTYQGVVHKTDWLDLYIETEGNSGDSDHTGSWISYIDNEDGNIIDYYTEPNDTCSDVDGTHEYPGWYHVALACVLTQLEVQDLTINIQSKPCVKEWKTECDSESQTCNVITDFSGGEHPNSTIPAIVKERQCDKILDDFTKEVEASSILVSGLDAERTADNLQVLNGWVPNFDDSQLWVKVSFSLEVFVVGVVTQGLAQDVERRVDSFKVEYENSAEGRQLVGGGVEFYAGARLDTKITNYFLQPVRAIAITIRVETPTDAKKVGMRFMLRGCKVCESHDDCDEDGQCKLEGKGMCSYGEEEAGLDPQIVNEVLESLEQKNATEGEKEALKTILGQGDEGSTINPEDVSLNVATEAIGALNISLKLDTNSSANSSEAVKNTIVAIEKVEGLLGVLSNEDSAAFNNLDSPEKIKEAEEMVGQMASLVSELFDPDKSAAWDVLADMAVGNDEGGSAENDTAGGGGGGGGGEPDGSDDTKAAEKEEEKQKVITEKTVNIVTSISTMASNIVQQETTSGEPLVIKTDTMEVRAEKIAAEEIEDNGFEFESENLGSTVAIPASNFADGEDVAITTAVIDTSVLRSKENTPPAASGKLASNLLSIQVFSADGKKSFSIEYGLSHREPLNDSDGNPIEKSGCTFYDEKTKEFSRKGLGVKEAKGNHTYCKSSHLTTFAVMMFLDNLDELGKHFKIQSDITKFCGGLSIIFLAVAIVIFIYLRSTLMSDRIIIHITLMGVTGVAMLAFLLGADKTKHELLCKIITVVLHFLYTAMFSWMLVEGMHLYRQIITVFESGKSRLWVYFVLGWGFPVLIVGVATGIQWHKYGKGEVCFLMNEDGTIWAFIGPIIPVILVNFVVLCRVIQIVIAASKLDGAGNTVVSVKAGLRSSVLLLPILGMTWVFGYFQHLDISLSYIFVILNSLQGFFMAIFHCFLNTEVREALKGAVKKAKDSSIGGHSRIDNTDKKSQMGSTVISRNKVAPSPVFD